MAVSRVSSADVSTPSTNLQFHPNFTSIYPIFHLRFLHMLYIHPINIRYERRSSLGEFEIFTLLQVAAF